MGFVRQSFKRQIFVVFLAVTLFLVIFGGILTVQGFQARVVADYERMDAQQEELVSGRVLDLLERSEATLDAVSQNEVLRNSFFKGRKNSLEIYSNLYEVTQDIRTFSVVDLYIGSRCMYSTRSGYKSDPLPDYYSVLYDAKTAAERQFMPWIREMLRSPVQLF